MLTKEQIVTLLRRDVVPALGCTEPGCVALCAAAAGKLLGGEIRKLSVEVNAGIYKNGMSAGIPNCGAVGLAHAAALGVYLKNPEKSLELLEDVTEEIGAAAEELVSAGKTEVRMDPAQHGLYARCVVTASDGTAECVIRGAHTNIVLLKRDGTVVFNKETEEGSASGDPLTDGLKNMTIAEIRDTVDTIPEEELRFLLDGVEMNERLAAYSEHVTAGVGLADALRKEKGSQLFPDDLLSRILLKVTSAAESRLDGCPLPTMSSSGAGTKGLVVILPVNETALALGVSDEKRVRALALAHLVNRYINAYIGKLSPMCTCVAASSTAAAVGMAYLCGADNTQLGYAVRNMTGSVTGMICDGGKVGCGLKVSAGSAAAYMAALTAVGNAPLRVTDGICAETPEACIRNMSRIGNNGMAQTDAEILKIMEEKH